MPNLAQNPVFSMPITTPTYDVGPEGVLRLSALLRWQQEAGENHLRSVNMNWEALAARGVAFVLARGGGVIHRLPVSGERVQVQTWGDHVDGIKFYRGYRVVDAAGECLTDCMGLFTPVDTVTHHLRRPDARDVDAIPCVRQSVCPLPILREPSHLEAAGAWTVRRSSLDFNGHLTNSVYADLLTDFLPPDVRAKTPRAFALCYLNEAREGDTLCLFYAADGDEHTVVARRDETTCFIGRVTV